MSSHIKIVGGSNWRLEIVDPGEGRLPGLLVTYARGERQFSGILLLDPNGQRRCLQDDCDALVTKREGGDLFCENGHCARRAALGD